MKGFYLFILGGAIMYLACLDSLVDMNKTIREQKVRIHKQDSVIKSLHDIHHNK